MNVIFCSGDYDLFDRIGGQDIRLLKTLRVKYICDLMVKKKNVKFGMRSDHHIIMKALTSYGYHPRMVGVTMEVKKLKILVGKFK